MKNYIFMWLKVFIALCCITVLPFYLLQDVNTAWKYVLLNSIVMSSLLTLLHAIGVRLNVGSWTYAPSRPVKVVKFDGDLESIKAGLLKSTGWTLAENSSSSAVFKVPMSFYSYGERLTITSLDGELFVQSEPVFPLTLVDYGKNIKNVNSVEKLIAD